MVYYYSSNYNLKYAILHNEYLYFWYLQYILMHIL